MIDDPWPEHENEEARGRGRPAGAKGDVAKDIEDRELVGKLGQPIKHGVSLAQEPLRMPGGGNSGARAP